MAAANNSATEKVASSVLKKAFALHQSGQIAEAIFLYREILAQDPKNADVLHLLGVIEAQKNNSPAAMALIDRAIALNPNDASYFSNRGLALHDLKRFEDALASFDHALAIKPDYAEALYNRGRALQALQRLPEALDSYDRVLAIKPGHANALNNRGLVLHGLQRFAEALASYARALAVKPDYAEALNNRGLALQRVNRFDDALASYARALAIKPGYVEAHNNRGFLLHRLERFDDALVSYARALAINPDHAEALNNRGIALYDLNRLDEALASYDRALGIKLGHVEALNNRGLALQGLKRLDEALASFDCALAIRPDYAEAHNNRAMARLLCGDFREGWPDYEWRWKAKNLPDRLPIDAPVWNGENLDGRSILIFAEQGRGDVIQFARYLPLLLQRGARVSFFGPAEITRLLGSMGATITFISTLAGEDPCDFQCALMSLPLRFGADALSIPNDVPYLRAEPDLVTRWKARIGNHGFKIGIAWQGSRQGKVDQGRSIPLAEFVALSRLPGVRLISLQKHDGLDQLMRLARDAGIEVPGEDFDPGPDAFIDTAAVMEIADLIVTSDTAIAHLAGALGRPTWVALKSVPDWRWGLEGDGSPWYPTMRLFRQATPGDWRNVFEQIAGELQSMTGRPSREYCP